MKLWMRLLFASLVGFAIWVFSFAFDYSQWWTILGLIFGFFIDVILPDGDILFDDLEDH